MPLLECDQLNRGRATGDLLPGWQEGEITFPPTFKYVIGTDTYLGSEDQGGHGGHGGHGHGEVESAKGQKKRTPAWCDRILWKSTKTVKLFGYSDVAAVKISDHKPVFCGFLIHCHEYLEERLDQAIQQARRLADLKEIEGRHALLLETP